MLPATSAAWCALANSAGFYGLYLLFFTLGFNTNEDPAHIFVLSGHMGGEPSPFLVVHNILLTGTLWVLGLAMPTVPWYTAHLVLGHFAAAAGFLYLLLRSTSVRTAMLVGIPVLVLFEGHFLLQLQFTHAAVALMAVGIGLLLRRDDPLAVRLVGLMMVLAGCMERNEAVFLAGGISAVPLLSALLDARQRPWLFAAGGLCALLLVVNVGVYRAQEGWREHAEWIGPVAKLGNLPGHDLGDELSGALSEVGWTDTDWNLYLSWFHEDPTVFERADVVFLNDRLLGSRPIGAALRLGWQQARQPFTGLDHTWSLLAAPLILDVQIYLGAELSEEIVVSALRETERIFEPGGIELRFDLSPKDHLSPPPRS